MGGSGKKRSQSFIDDSNDEGPEVETKATKKNKTAAAVTAGKDDDGNPFWELSNKRRVGVSKFKNMCFVNIREYYEKDGKTLPGKKGISLSVEQYTALIKLVPKINSSLRELGHAVDNLDSDLDENSQEAPAMACKKESKANIDTTSEEEE